MSNKRNNPIILLIIILTLAAFAMSACTSETPAPTATAVPTEAPTAEVIPTEEPAAPTEESSDLTEEPAAPTGDPAVPTEEPEMPAEEPETPAEGPETPAEEPETPAEGPETPAEEPETPAETSAEPGSNVVASVDGREITAESFTELVTFNRYQYLNMYYQYAQMYAMYGIPLDDLNEQVSELLGENGRESLGLEAIDQLTYDQVLEIEAEKRGLEISEDEVYSQLKMMFGYEDTEEEESPLGMDTFNIGDDDTETAEEKNAEFREFAEMVLADSYDGAVSFEYLQNYAKHILMDNIMFEEELNSRVFEEEQVNARHILVEDEESAKAILEKLAAGESWDDLASENSLDTSNKDSSGSLGWFSRGMMVSEFEDAAFALEPGEISEPVQTAYGYHIIASDGKEVRPLEGDALTAAQNALYDDWSIGLREDHDIKTYEEVWLDAIPMEPVFEPIEIDTEANTDENDFEYEWVEVEPEDAETEGTDVDLTPIEAEAETEEPTEANPAEEPVEEVPAEEPAAETPADETPAEEPAEEPVEEPAEPEAEAETEEPTEETPAEEPAEEPVEEPAAETPAEETPAEEPAEEPVEEPAEPEAEAAAAEDQVIATVDGEPVSTEEFIQSATFSRYQYLNTYNQYAQMYSMYGLPLDSLNSQVEAILGESGKANLGMESIRELTYNRVLELEAEETGVEVTEDEVYARLKEMFGYEDPSAQDNSLLGLEVVNVDPTVTDDSEDKKAEFRTYAEMVLALGYNGNVSFDYLKSYAKHGLLETKLFAEELSTRVFEAEQVNARHILVETEETAKEIREKLDAGEDWDALAAEYNLDSGTNLGWFGRGVMVSEFEEAAFALEPGQISDPVKTQYGYHIIASDGKEMRPLEGTALETAQNQVFQEWSDGLNAKHDIQNFEDVWMPLVPTEPAFDPIVTETEEPAAEEAAAEETAEETPAEEPAEEAPAEEPAAEEPVEEAPAEEPAKPAIRVNPAASGNDSSESTDWEPVKKMTVPSAEEPAAEEAPAEEPVEKTPSEEAAEEAPAEGSAKPAIRVNPAASGNDSSESTDWEPVKKMTVPSAEEPAAEEAVEETPAEEPAAEETVTEEAPAEEPAQPAIRVNPAASGKDSSESTDWSPVKKMTVPSAEEPAAEEAVEETPAEEPAAEVAAEEPAEDSVAEEPVEEAPAEEPAAEEPVVEAEEASDTDVIVGAVNGMPITAEEFVSTAAFNRYQMITEYQQYAQFYAMFGIPLDEVNAMYESYLGTSEAAKKAFGQETFNNTALFRIAEIEAEKAGIEISNKEVVSRMKEIFGYTDAAAETESTFGLDSFNIGADETDDAEDEMAFRADVDSVLALSYNDQITYDFWKGYVRANMLLTELYEKELANHVFESEQVNARHILVGDEETANDILAKIEAGESWEALASEHSMDTSNKDNGGALGWFGRGVMVKEFEDAAFALEPGEISAPVKTTYGYHIIASDGKEVRPLEDSELETAQNEVFSEWYQNLPSGYAIESFEEVWLPLVPEEPAFEPITVEANDSIPTYQIGSMDEEDAEDDLFISSTEQETGDDEPEISPEDGEWNITIDNTEQDEGAFLLNNDEETETAAEDEDIPTISSTEQEDGGISINNTEQEDDGAISINNTEQEDDSAISINNTEQDEGAFLLENDKEVE